LILGVRRDARLPLGERGDRPREEIWAWGIRASWGMSFDRETEEFYVADVGQDLWEEVNRMESPGNYGWNIKEGAHWFDPDNPHIVITEGPDTGPLGEELIDPIIEYGKTRGRQRGVGVVVIGGYVYRGSAVPELQGHYVFGDWSRFLDAPVGVLMVAAPAEEGEMWPWREVMEIEAGAIMGFGEDAEGELCVLTNGSHGPRGENGRVYRIVTPQ
jgi:glucose/arabinose dehydrogenase